MSLMKIIDKKLTTEKIYKAVFENQSPSSIFYHLFLDYYNTSDFEIEETPFNNLFLNFNHISPFAYALSQNNFNFIQAFVDFLKNNNQKINLDDYEVCFSSRYENYNLARTIAFALDSGYLPHKNKLILAEILKFAENGFDYRSQYNTAINWAIQNKNEQTLTYFTPIILADYYNICVNILQRNHHNVFFEYVKNIVVNSPFSNSKTSKFENQHLSKILDNRFLFEYCKGSSKKNQDVQKENLEYFFSLIDKKALFEKIYSAREKSKGLTDPFITLENNKNNPVLILIKKDALSLLNIFFDNGYIPDNEEIKLILNSKKFDDINEEHKHYFNSQTVDKLEVLVKGFEFHLLKRQKTSNKNLRQFLSSLSEDDKNYLYDYYEQFKETNLSSYSFLDVTGINNDTISVIDHIVKEGLYEQVNLLLENNFRFTNDQTRNFLDILSYNNVNSDYTKYDSSFSLEKFLTNINKYLPESQIKNMFIYQVTYGYKMAFQHMDMLYNILLKDISFTETDVNLIISGRNPCQALLYKLSKDNTHHFFNHNSLFNYIKDFYLNMIFYNGKKKYHSYNLHEDFTESPLCLKLAAKVAKIQPEFISQLKNNLTNSSLDNSEVNEVMTYIEKSIITLDLDIAENSGNDKVKIRRRI